jgi:uncharacterized protein (TIGR03382 family)
MQLGRLGPKSLFLLGSVYGVSSARADVTVAVMADKDAMIFATASGSDTGNASGKGPALFAGADGGSRMKRSMVTFDLASAAIPSDATITGASMTLYLAQIAGSGGGTSTGGSYPSRKLRLFRLQDDWGEGPSGSPTSPTVGGTGQGYLAQTGDSTWDYAFYTATPWQNPGGDVVTADVAAVSFEEPFVPGQAFAWSTSEMLSDARNWQTGQTKNYGWMLRSDLETSPTSFLGFWSRDGAEANNLPALAPQLSITYTCPNGDCPDNSGSDVGMSGTDGKTGGGCNSAPTPGSLAPFALVVLWLFRRRVRDVRRAS